MASYNYTPLSNGQYVDYKNDEDRYKEEGFCEATAARSSSMMEKVVVGYIGHKVSKLDTLAGLAIMYSVEVADIKKMNGLFTDLQMLALKSIQIPLPGRHPPSPYLLNGSHSATGQNCSEQTTPPHRLHLDFLDSFQSLKLTSSQGKVSTAMCSLQGYYGLKPTDPKTTSEGFDIAVYSQGNSSSREGGQYIKPSPDSNPLSCHKKSINLANGILDDINEGFPGTLLAESEEIGFGRWNEILVRRHQKSLADFTSHTKLLMREENSASAHSTAKGKGLAQRSNAATRNTSFAVDSETGGSTSVRINLQESSAAADGFPAVRKSSSTSSLQEQDGSTCSIWQTPKWNLKPDLQAFTAAAIAKPLFDGLPKSVTGRRNKAAVD